MNNANNNANNNMNNNTNNNMNNNKIKHYYNLNDNIIDDYDDTREYMINELKKSDNPVYFRDTVEEPKDEETKLAVDKISNKLDNIFLRPVYVNNYFVCDSFYSNWQIEYIKNIFTFPLSSNTISSSNDVVALKYPISESIQFNLLPYNIPPYAVKSEGGYWNGYEMIISPSNRRIKITVSEIIEVFNSTPIEKYTIIADCIYDNETIDGVNYPYISRIIPTNDGNIIYRFALKDLTKVTISMNDFRNDMIFPKPTIEGITFTPGNPSIFTVDTSTNPLGCFLINNQFVYINNFNTDQPITDINIINKINSVVGYKITNIPGNIYQFSIPVDSSAMVGTSNQTYTITVSNRRILFPFVINQLRPDIVF